MGTLKVWVFTFHTTYKNYQTQLLWLASLVIERAWISQSYSHFPSCSHCWHSLPWVDRFSILVSFQRKCNNQTWSGAWIFSYLRRVGRVTRWSCAHQISGYKQTVINVVIEAREELLPLIPCLCLMKEHKTLCTHCFLSTQRHFTKPESLIKPSFLCFPIKIPVAAWNEFGWMSCAGC